ncbi:hypothetical protein HN814_12140, partial [Candidatus Woesearchaeota archaeon]|nr:hypothetical protein [Candidatus Woesearchaeota archaeon]
KTFDDMAFARSVIEETQKLEALDSDIDLMKANRLVRSLICEIEFDFKHMYNLRKKLSGFVTAFLKKISSISDLQSIVKTEIISLRLKEQKYSDLLSSQVEYVLNRTYHLIKILTYLERHDRVNKSLTPLLQDHEINFQKIVHVKLAEYGVSFRKARSLDINYKCSEKTFLRESKRLVGDRLFIQRNSVEDVKKCINILYNLIKLIRQEYVHKCDSPYHGIEHVSQVTITTLRIFIKYQRIHKSVNLVDFFIVMSAAILHDVGYFTEHFRHSAPGYLSSMYHDGHEIRSAKHAKKYLSHFRKEIESLGIGLFDELIKSIQNVISSTRVRGDSFREDLDVELQKILRASDLLEMCSERYINYLIPLYKENKIGDPKCAWPVSLHELISGTPFFMTQLELVQKRVKLMIDYLDAYPVYKQNLDAISHNLVAYEQVLKKEQKVHEGLMVDFERKG